MDFFYVRRFYGFFLCLIYMHLLMRWMDKYLYR